MAKKRSKRYKAAAALVDNVRVYSIEDAVALVKKLPAPKFDQTVTLTFRMGVDPRQSDQMVRGTCPLPHGSGKDVRVSRLRGRRSGHGSEERRCRTSVSRR
jgi:large subunit ribosomal protein L1